MTHRTFADVTDKVLGLIEPALESLESGGSEGELADVRPVLKQLLIDLMRLLERNPGIEAAAADLYVAASALVRDTAAGASPSARMLRVFRELRVRFRARLVAARPTEEGSEIVWRHQELLFA